MTSLLTWLLVCLAGAGGGAFPGMAGHRDPEPSPTAGQSRHTGPSLCSNFAGAVQTRSPVDSSSPSRRMRRVAVAIEANRLRGAERPQLASASPQDRGRHSPQQTLLVSTDLFLRRVTGCCFLLVCLCSMNSLLANSEGKEERTLP